MLRKIAFMLLGLCSLPLCSPAQDSGFQNLFNGKDLTGWDGLPQFWSVKDGVIHGQTTEENPTNGNTFLIWQDGEVADFEFVAEVRFQGNNSGVQYRSSVVDAEKFVLAGYQADLHPKPEFFGMLYGEKMGKRGIITQRGQQMVIDAEGKKEVTGKVGDGATLTDWEWNEIRVVAVGDRLIHQINGVTTVDITDQVPDAPKKGKLGLQLHGGPPMEVEFRNLKLRHLKGDEAGKVLEGVIAASKAHAKKQAAAKPGPESDAWLKAEPIPQWIWSKKASNGQKLYFRKAFTVPANATGAQLYATCDNQLKLWINGKQVGTSPDWPQPIELDAFTHLKPGEENVIAAEGINKAGSAGFVFKMKIASQDGKITTLISDDSWTMADSVEEGWQKGATELAAINPTVLGNLGKAPWGIPSHSAKNAPAKSGSGPLEGAELTTLEGFKAELLYTVPKDKEGSWVAMTVDPQGRLITSDQGKAGLFRVTVSDKGEKASVSVEPMPLKHPENPEQNISGAQGLVYHGEDLYLHINGGPLYRTRDNDGDDLPDVVEQLPSSTGGGEHGNHAVIQDHEGKSLLIDGGNHAELPPEESIVRQRVTTWDEDLLLPRMWDARGHARGRLAPGGWVTSFDPETQTHEIVSIGYRNQYDLALNRYGDAFTYDADMEWDMGMPWYRPTRLCMVVSGSDYGWRSGSGKWPTYYEDSLPPIIDIGPGSPTGVASGLGAKFPAKYQDAIYAFDWTFGTIYAVHLNPNGAGYEATSEAFVHGSPLAVTDGIIGQDGHFYFLTGGRGTQSALYRIRYTGDASTEPSTGNDTEEAATARTLRRQLEGFHGEEALTAIPTAWPILSSKDRFLRNAARVAVESQPVNQWADKVYAEPNAQARITASVALARSGDESHRAGLIASLLGLDTSTLSEGEMLGLLRAYSLTFIRLGDPTAEEKEQIVAQLNPMLPAESAPLNLELLTVLTYLRAPGVVDKGMALILDSEGSTPPDWQEVASRNARYGGNIQKMLENYPPSEQLAYAFVLRNATEGWSMDQRRAYFAFLNEAAQKSGGASYPGFLENIREEALASTTDEERTALADVTGENFNPVPDFEILPPEGPGRTWTLEEALAQSSRGKPNFEKGRSLYFAASCGACHRIAGLGGAIGPDLTSIPNKFDAAYVLEAIIDPSKDISDQYGSSIVKLKDGMQAMGLAIPKGDTIEVWPPDPKAGPTVIQRTDVDTIEESPVSQMPPGLINMLNPEELRDLMAYLMSGGNEKDRMYR